MPQDVRIGAEPPPTPPPRSGRVLLITGAVVLLAAFVAWLAGGFAREAPATTSVAITFTTTSTTAGTTTTLSPSELDGAVRNFWYALGEGDVASAIAAFPGTTPSAADLIGFVAALDAGLRSVGDCSPLGAHAVQCLIVVSNPDLLEIGTGPNPEEAVVLLDDGTFDVPQRLATAVSRLSLYALEAHTEEVRAACPVTDNPQVPRLAIVGSATAGCGAYLAGLIPEYLSAVLGLSGGPRE